MDRLRFLLLLLLVAAVHCASPAEAGNTADLKGRISDSTAQPLPGATVTLHNEGLAIADRGTVTDAAGNYRFAGLPAGTGYRLRISLPSFAPVELSDIELTQGQVSILDVVLVPASEVQETIRVPARPRVVDTETVTTSTTFNSEFIAGLPVLGRDYQDILSLAPGVTDVNGTGNPNIHGARDTGVVTLVDGVSTTDPFTGLYGQQLNIESIQEIEVITSGATAEYSRAQGGFANIVTKSGTNEFSGTFKFFLRSSVLDGDGAGTDPPELRKGFGESSELEFKDLYPFLSLAGPIARDRLWYYLANEYIFIESPHNVLTQVVVPRSHGFREFGKITWQIAPSQKLAFSVIVDRMVDENQGVDSLTEVESGYSFKRGGPTYTLRETATFGPQLLLESSVSWFDNNFALTPTISPDTNHNGLFSTDGVPWLGGNGDGIFEARETDSGMEFDRDGKWDIWEDLNHNLVEDPGEDLDGDGRWMGSWWEGGSYGCEGEEDLNCDGRITREIDANLNGVVDPEEDVGLQCEVPMLCKGWVAPGTAGNGQFDSEDRNGNGVLDTVGDSGPTPFPFWEDSNGNGRPDAGEFLAPLTADAIYHLDEFGRQHGPYFEQYDDQRKRFTLKEELSFYVADFGGTHDLKVGGTWEHEAIDRTVVQRPQVTEPRVNLGSPSGGETAGGNIRPLTRTLLAFLAVPSLVRNEAVADNLGFFLQDTYKPLPNLTLGLGVRVDGESIHSQGYTPFDPAAERMHYNLAMGLTGFDADAYDTIIPLGLASDPLYAATGGSSNHHVAQIANRITTLIPNFFTRHLGNLEVVSPYLISSLPPGTLSLSELEAAGARFRKPESFTVDNINVAPRLSVSWDPFADGKSKGFASWSRYYDKLFLEAMTLELGPDSATRSYVFDEWGYDYEGYPNNGFGKVLGQSALSAFQVDRSLKTPRTDEWTVGFQRELAPEISLALTYIHRDYENQLQDVDVNHFTRIEAATGRLTDYFGKEYCIECRDPAVEPTSARPPAQRVPDGLPDLYIQNFLFNRIMRLGNYNTQTYRGFELELVKRLSRKWQLESSYTYSRSWGDAESYNTAFGSDPTVTEYETGYLDYDQRHVIKLNTVAYLPRDWQMGVRAQWASGLPFSFLEGGSAADDVGYQQSRRRFGHTDQHFGFFPEHRNIHRNHAVYEFDVRAQKNFVMGKASASAYLEVFNLLNTDDLRIYAIYPRYRSAVVGEREFGRRFQVGFQIDF